MMMMIVIRQLLSTKSACSHASRLGHWCTLRVVGPFLSSRDSQFRSASKLNQTWPASRDQARERERERERKRDTRSLSREFVGRLLGPNWRGRRISRDKE